MIIYFFLKRENIWKLEKRQWWEGNDVQRKYENDEKKTTVILKRHRDDKKQKPRTKDEIQCKRRLRPLKKKKKVEQ